MPGKAHPIPWLSEKSGGGKAILLVFAMPVEKEATPINSSGKRRWLRDLLPVEPIESIWRRWIHRKPQ
jgi:hypothetical protein